MRQHDQKTKPRPATGDRVVVARNRPPCREGCTDAQAITIEVFKDLAFVHPPPMNCAQERLEYTEVVFEAAGRLGHRSRRVKRRLYDLDDRGRLIVPAGMVQSLVEHLQHGGHEVEVRDHRCRPKRCQVTNERLLCELSELERTFLLSVTANPLGQIVVRGQQELVRAIEIICRYYQGALVHIPVATKRRMSELFDALNAPLRRIVSKAKGLDWWRDSNRVVCSYTALETSLEADILIFPEVATMFNTKVTRGMRDLPGMQLRYGITQADQTLDPVTRLRLECWLGPVIFQSPDPRGEPAQVEVFVVEAPFMHPVGVQDALGRKRCLFWKNQARNQMIAEVATAVAHGDQETLWRHGLGLDQDDERFGKPSRVAVLAESLEHGRVLQGKLPTWRRLSEAPPAGPARILTLPDRTILTVAFASKAPELATDVWVIASGGDALADLQGFPPRRQIPAKPVTVIDIADDCDQQAVKETQRRLDSYRLRGWRINGAQAMDNSLRPAT